MFEEKFDLKKQDVTFQVDIENSMTCFSRIKKMFRIQIFEKFII